MRLGGIAASVLLLLGTAPVEAGHGTLQEFDSRRATPGMRLELSEIPSPPGASVAYRLRATGVPRHVTFDVFARAFRQPFRELAAGFRLDETGRLVANDPGEARPQPLDTMTFRPGPYPRGAVWEVALISQDRTISAFARVIPLPLVARDGPCAIALELVSHRGERFLAVGTGFVPGEEVVVESRYAGQATRKQRRISAEGQLPPEIILLASTGGDRTARYMVHGRACTVKLDYEWGEAAFRPN
jgi:hypothetical protein